MTNRRKVAARKITVFQQLAKLLIKAGLRPNHISIASAIFAMLAGLALAFSFQAERKLQIFLYSLAIIGIQARLVCNLVDGLMAVEGKLQTASGELFNDVPDRISDVVILIGAGCAARTLSLEMIYLGWTAALLAVLTAYVRTLGAAMTGRHDFSGPMAKQHRMFLVTLGCVGAVAESFSLWSAGYSMSVMLVLVIVGSFLTCLNRLYKLYDYLEKK